jgi:hypothetical protein
MIALNLAGAAELPAPGMRTILAGRDAALLSDTREPKLRLGEAGFAILSPAAEP